ncbi:hypothetical protein [Hoeflea sp.]|uniref:hypothetical protein n=1 Tax=Hoeflea sp. TaxID=1940281 RepID=UPI003B013EB4
MPDNGFSNVPGQYFLDVNATPRGRRGKLNMRQKEALLKRYAAGEPTSEIADHYDVDETYIRKLASRYRVRKGTVACPARKQISSTSGPPGDSHLTAFKYARRGFHVPDHLEQQYTDLLVRGLSCRQAAWKLGLVESA